MISINSRFGVCYLCNQQIDIENQPFVVEKSDYPGPDGSETMYEISHLHCVFMLEQELETASSYGPEYYTYDYDKMGPPPFCTNRNFL